MTKKIFAILMSAMMMLTFMPAMAFAEGETSLVIKNGKRDTITSMDFKDLYTGTISGTLDPSTGVMKEFAYDATKMGDSGAVLTVTQGTAVSESFTLATSPKTSKVKLYAVKWDDAKSAPAEETPVFYDLTSDKMPVVFSGGTATFAILAAVTGSYEGFTPETVRLSLVSNGSIVKYLDFNFVAETAVAKIGNKYYTSFDEAIKAASQSQISTDTIELLQDVESDAVIDRPVIINGLHTDDKGAHYHSIKGEVKVNAGFVTLKNLGEETKTITVSSDHKSVSLEGKIGNADTKVTVLTNSTLISDNLTEFKGTIIANDTQVLDDRFVCNSTAAPWNYTMDGTCKYNGKIYPSIEKVFEAAKTISDTTVDVELVADSVQDVEVPLNTTLTIDGTKYTLTGELKVKKVETTTTGTTDVDGKLVIKSGHFSSDPKEYTGELGVVKVNNEYVVGLDNIKAAIDDATELKSVTWTKYGADVFGALSDIASKANAKKVELYAEANAIIGREFTDTEKGLLKLDSTEDYVALDSGKWVVLKKTDAAEYNSQKDQIKSVLETISIEKGYVTRTTTSVTLKLTTKTDGVLFEVNGMDAVDGEIKIDGFKTAGKKEVKVVPYKNITINGTSYRIHGAERIINAYSKPAKVSKPTVKAGKKLLKVSYKKATGAKKYQISVSTKSTGTNIKYTGTSRTKTIKKLKAKKTYYVKVRAKSSAGVYGSWSTARKIKTK